MGLQAVNHFNQFTSVTINYNLQPGAADSEAAKFITDSAKQILAETPAVQGTFQGEALVLQQLISALVPLVIGAVFVMYIILGILYESYIHPITVLSTLPPAIVGGLGNAVAVSFHVVSLQHHRAVPADGHREEKRHHDRGFCLAATRRRDWTAARRSTRRALSGSGRS